MGYYINPRNGDKRGWLTQNATKRASEPSERLDGQHWVCLVDNGAFEAAAIAFDERELEAFQYEGDLRPKVWYLVPDEKLIEVEPSVTGQLT